MEERLEVVGQVFFLLCGLCALGLFTLSGMDSDLPNVWRPNLIDARSTLAEVDENTSEESYLTLAYDASSSCPECLTLSHWVVGTASLTWLSGWAENDWISILEKSLRGLNPLE